jgi:hypothetical protein
MEAGRVDKVAGYIGRSDECRMLASAAVIDDIKLEYLKLSEGWLELATERRAFLIAAGRLH